MDLHSAHVSVKTREDDLPAIGASIDGTENVVGHEIAIKVLNVCGRHVLARVGVLDLNVETNVAWNLLEQLCTKNSSKVSTTCTFGLS